MMTVTIEISDDPMYCYDSTKKLCGWVRSSNFGSHWNCWLFSNERLFDDKTQKLIKCKQCLEIYKNERSKQ